MMVIDGEKDLAHMKSSGVQWDLAEKVVAMLKPFEVETTVLSMKQNSSLSYIYPVHFGCVNQQPEGEGR